MEAKRAYMCKERIVDLEFKISRLGAGRNSWPTPNFVVVTHVTQYMEHDTSEETPAIERLSRKNGKRRRLRVKSGGGSEITNGGTKKRFLVQRKDPGYVLSGLLGKAYYDLVQIKLRRHRNQISIARTQNTLLHAALDTLRHKARIARKNLGDLESLRKTVASLRVTYDHQRKLVFSRQKKLEAQVTDTHSAELECAGVLDPNTPDSVRIRRLEAVLNSIRLKTKDVQILMRHYEATLKPMKDEYASYSAKLEAVQTILNVKIVECEKLINTHHDAIRARDVSKKELEELIGMLFGKNGRTLVSPELQNKILAAIKEIKDVMEVRSMREMYHQFILQEKQSAYLESIFVELKRTVDQLKNDYPPRRKSTMQPHAVRSMIEGTKQMVRRQFSRRGSIPLLQILDGTQKLVERLHEGNVTMPTEEGKMKEVLTKCQDKMSNLMQAVHRKLKHMQKEAHKKAKEDAEAAGQAYVREARFAELDAEDDARKAAKDERHAEIRREIVAREAESRRKEEEALAAREERRAQVRAEMARIRERSKKEAEAQAEAIRKWQKEHEPARSSKSLASTSAGAQRGKSIKTAESMKDAVERTGRGSLREPDHKSPESPVTVPSSEHAAETDVEIENDPAEGAQAPTGEKKEEPPPPVAEKRESPEEALPSSLPSQAKEEVRTAAAPSCTELQVQPSVAPSSPEQAAEMGPQARSSRVRVTLTASGAEAAELRVHLQEPPTMADQGESPDVSVTSSSPSAAKEEIRTAAALSCTEPPVQPAASPSSQEQVAEMGPRARSSQVSVTFTATAAAAGELRVNPLAAMANKEDEVRLAEGVTTQVTVPSSPEYASPSGEETKQPQVQLPPRSSSAGHGAKEETDPRE